VAGVASAGELDVKTVVAPGVYLGTLFCMNGAPATDEAR
jgi:hypothetical protein